MKYLNKSFKEHTLCSNVKTATNLNYSIALRSSLPNRNLECMHEKYYFKFVYIMHIRQNEI